TLLHDDRALNSFPTRRSSDLARALQQRPGAADDFERWARTMAEDWGDTALVCAAHSAVHQVGSEGFAAEVEKALTAIQPVLARRSEEHTSELQSRENLVCRLL